jgi:hypothetical protein
VPDIKIPKDSKKVVYIDKLVVYHNKDGRIHIADESMNIICPKDSDIEKFFIRYLYED